MLAAVLSTIIGFIEVLVGLRFVLRLIGANPLSGFVNFVYDWSSPLVQPFAGIFGQSAKIAGEGAVVPSVFDWTALIALVFYAVVGALVIGLGARGRRHPAY